MKISESECGYVTLIPSQKSLIREFSFLLLSFCLKTIENITALIVRSQITAYLT